MSPLISPIRGMHTLAPGTHRERAGRSSARSHTKHFQNKRSPWHYIAESVSPKKK